MENRSLRPGERRRSAAESDVRSSCEHQVAVAKLIHVMNTIDALDVNVSDVSRTDEKIPLIQRVCRYAFHEKKLVGQPLFKLPFESGSDMIVDDEFRKVVEANRLRGLKFKELPRAR